MPNIILNNPWYSYFITGVIVYFLFLLSNKYKFRWYTQDKLEEDSDKIAAFVGVSIGVIGLWPVAIVVILFLLAYRFIIPR